VRAKRGQPRGLILVVDDDPAVRLLLRRCLSHWRVEEAADGLEGLARLRQLAPDLAIVDWGMPRMDGMELVRQMRADPQLRHVPVVLLTARTDVEHRAEGYHSGADHFLPKPFEPEELLAIVERAVERSQPLNYAAPLLQALHDRVALADMPQLGEALSLLGEFQQRMLPPGEVHLGPVSAGACLVPSQIASGDFYDYIPWDAGRALGFVVGDVSGRGLAAAYFMVMVRTILRVLAREQHGLVETVSVLNDTLHAETPTGWFVTLFYGVVNPWTAELRYVNAGHCPAVLCSGDAPPALLDTTGPALGLFARHGYEERTVKLQPGDHVVCATDGVIDAVRTQDTGKRYAWMARMVAQGRSRSILEVATALVEGARNEAEGGHKDDLTAVVVRQNGRTEGSGPAIED